MAAPTPGEILSKLIADLSYAQEGMAMMGHIIKSEASNPKQQALGDGWIAMSELMLRTRHHIIEMAKSKLQ